MGTGNDEVIVAAVALIISVVALSATFMQVLQQYYSSARGYSNVNDKVMGDWAKSKSRRFSWEELRFEVQFDAPVIFVSPPTNKNGPVPDSPIYFLDGTQKSLDETWTTSDMDLRREYKMRSAKERIHTADNERASWFILLYAVQRMEAKSREWQQEEFKALQEECKALGPPGSEPSVIYGLPRAAPTLVDHHTLTVALQRKRKSWDTMPPTITKPYATTTMCHLIEMMAALGVYWKEFDRKRDRYWAEGNGFMVLGERISDLGLMFSFQVYGQGQFEKNRVIPVDEIKELCFGYVPTIYREKLDQRRLKPPSDEPRNLSSLQMGSIREIGETLTLLGCNNYTVRYLLDGKRTSHLFPISFEILGMLSRMFHIENSSFTCIPNPTPDRWEESSVSLSSMMEACWEKLGHETHGMKRNPVVISRLRNHLEEILRHQDDKSSLERLLCLRALHMALDDADEILTAKTKKARQNGNGESNHPSTDNASERPSKQVPGPQTHISRRGMVQDVMRYHLQEVLRLLNDGDDRNSDSQSLHPDMVPSSPLARPHDMPKPPSARFEDVYAAGPDERQAIFMDVYFDVVRKKVMMSVANLTERRSSLAGPPPGLNRFLAAGSIRTRDSGSVRAMPTNGAAHIPHDHLDKSTAAKSVSGDDGDGNHDDDFTVKDIPQDAWEEDASKIPLANQPVSHEDVWCTLVFRMICWLMLHDFNKKDVQVSKSELLGSRMPVYIA